MHVFAVSNLAQRALVNKTTPQGGLDGLIVVVIHMNRDPVRAHFIERVPVHLFQERAPAPARTLGTDGELNVMRPKGAVHDHAYQPPLVEQRQRSAGRREPHLESPARPCQE